jgi:hypothetical protein
MKIIFKKKKAQVYLTWAGINNYFPVTIDNLSAQLENFALPAEFLSRS